MTTRVRKKSLYKMMIIVIHQMKNSQSKIKRKVLSKADVKRKLKKLTRQTKTEMIMMVKIKSVRSLT